MLTEGRDYYLDSNGYMVFTEKYHLERGYCCKNGCRHCPWEYSTGKEQNEIKDSSPLAADA